MTSISVARTIAIAILAWYAMGLPAQAAGMNCSKAKSKVERLICDDQTDLGLYVLDRTLNILYQEAGVRVGAVNLRPISEEQRNWLKNTRNLCDDAQCLKKAYRIRIGELQQIATLCKPQETIIFSCTLNFKKAISLCVSSDAGPEKGYMQFRMESDQQGVVLEYPQKLTPARNNFQYLGGDWSETKAVSFWTGDDRYIVLTRWDRDPYSKSLFGLVVSQRNSRTRASYSQCIREPVILYSGHGYTTNFGTLDKALRLPDAGQEIESILDEVY